MKGRWTEKEGEEEREREKGKVRARIRVRGRKWGGKQPEKGNEYECLLLKVIYALK